MSAERVYQDVQELLNEHLDPRVDPSSRERIALLVTGMLKARSASPARVAAAIAELGLSHASVESIERRIRRIENDPELTAATCVHPLAQARLAYGKPRALWLIIDPTTQEDRVVMVSVAVWYRGRALPLAWAVWPANQPLEGDDFWTRIEALLDVVKPLLPARIPITWLADRAFGCARFTDMLLARGWHFVVRAQGQTRCRDRQGRIRRLDALVLRPGRRAKLRGEVFKKQGWREASVVVYWGKAHRSPLCLVSDFPPRWYLIQWYRRRYPIEAKFRDYKSSGWQWEQGQVTDLAHLERLLVGMALATWIALGVGSQVACEYLSKPATGRRRSMPYEGKRSLFQLGLQRIAQHLSGVYEQPLPWELKGWDWPNWSTQIRQHHAKAYVFAARDVAA